MERVFRTFLCLLEITRVALGLRGLGEGAADQVGSHPEDPDVAVSLVVQGRPHVLGHEVHTQDADLLAPALGNHVHSPVRHHEGVTDVDVWPISLCSGKHSLNLRVHVEVRHHPALGLAKQVNQPPHPGRIRLQVPCLRLCVRTLGVQALCSHHQRGEGLWNGTVRQGELVRPLSHGVEDGVQAVSVVASGQDRVHISGHTLQEVRAERKELAWGHLSRKVAAEGGAQPARHGAVAVSSEAHEATARVHDLRGEPNPRRATRDPPLVGPFELLALVIVFGAARPHEPAQQS